MVFEIFTCNRQKTLQCSHRVNEINHYYYTNNITNFQMNLLKFVKTSLPSEIVSPIYFKYGQINTFEIEFAKYSIC